MYFLGFCPDLHVPLGSRVDVASCWGGKLCTIVPASVAACSTVVDGRLQVLVVCPAAGRNVAGWRHNGWCGGAGSAVREPVSVRYDGVRLVEMGQKIQHTGSAISAVRLVDDSEERVFDGAKKMLAQGAVDVRESVEGKRHRVMCVSDGRSFGAGRAGRDDGRCAGIERGDYFCGQEGGIVA